MQSVFILTVLAVWLFSLITEGYAAWMQGRLDGHVNLPADIDLACDLFAMTFEEASTHCMSPVIDFEKEPGGPFEHFGQKGYLSDRRYAVCKGNAGGPLRLSFACSDESGIDLIAELRKTLKDCAGDSVRLHTEFFNTPRGGEELEIELIVDAELSVSRVGSLNFLGLTVPGILVATLSLEYSEFSRNYPTALAA